MTMMACQANESELEKLFLRRWLGTYCCDSAGSRDCAHRPAGLSESVPEHDDQSVCIKERGRKSIAFAIDGRGDWNGGIDLMARTFLSSSMAEIETRRVQTALALKPRDVPEWSFRVDGEPIRV